MELLEGALELIQAVSIFVLAIVYFRIINNLFEITYFGCQGFFGVIFTSLMLATVTTMIIGSIFIKIWNILYFIIKWGVIITVGFLVLFLALELLLVILEKIGITNSSESSNEISNKRIIVKNIIKSKKIITSLILIIIGGGLILSINNENNKDQYQVQLEDKTNYKQEENTEIDSLDGSENLSINKENSDEDIPIGEYENIESNNIEMNDEYVEEAMNNNENLDYQELVFQNIIASSELNDKTGISYTPKNVVDQDSSTTWAEGVDGFGRDEWIQLDLGGVKTVKRLEIINGLVNSNNGYKKNNRLKEARLEFSDGNYMIIDLEDDNIEEQKIDLGENGVKTSFIRLVILDVYGGDKYNDTCISRIKAYGV